MMNAEVLYGLFLARLNRICSRAISRDQRIEAWKRLVFGYGCRIVYEGEIIDLVNHGPGENVLIKSINVEAGGRAWVLVPRNLADKALVLGGIP